MTGTAPAAWARHGAACSLPTYVIDPDTGDRVKGVLSPWVPIRLRFSHIDDEGRKVWVVPAERFGPGASIRLDPLTDAVRVTYEVLRL